MTPIPASADPQELSRLLLPIQPDDHVHGSETAPLTLVEYGDYECPECGRVFDLLAELQRESPEILRIAYRHYPLSGIHPHAQEAAEASEAAGAQGKFWEMHDLLFQNRGHLGRKDLERYAAQLGLDEERFRKELKARTWEQRVKDHFRRGVQNGVYGTPGLFVNGVRHAGPIDRARLLAYIQPAANGKRPWE
jgi:protein-disulfide isomerase